MTSATGCIYAHENIPYLIQAQQYPSIQLQCKLKCIFLSHYRFLRRLQLSSDFSLQHHRCNCKISWLALLPTSLLHSKHSISSNLIYIRCSNHRSLKWCHRGSTSSWSNKQKNVSSKSWYIHKYQLCSPEYYQTGVIHWVTMENSLVHIFSLYICHSWSQQHHCNHIEFPSRSALVPTSIGRFPVSEKLLFLFNSDQSM